MFGTGWKIHGTNVYGRSRSQASGNNVHVVVVRCSAVAPCRSARSVLPAQEALLDLSAEASHSHVPVRSEMK